jgi:hypothetical protein
VSTPDRGATTAESSTRRHWIEGHGERGCHRLRRGRCCGAPPPLPLETAKGIMRMRVGGLLEAEHCSHVTHFGLGGPDGDIVGDSLIV